MKSEVIKYHQKKDLFVGGKGHKLPYGYSVAQLSGKVAQCHTAKNGLVM